MYSMGLLFLLFLLISFLLFLLISLLLFFFSFLFSCIASAVWLLLDLGVLSFFSACRGARVLNSKGMDLVLGGVNGIILAYFC